MKKKLSLLMSVVMLMTSLLCTNAFASFSDVTADNTYRKAITTLSNLNIINGYEDGTFKPDAEITRAEFAKIIVYTLNYASLQTTSNRFSDVEDHWAKQEINLCSDFSIIDGMGDGTFHPDDHVTLEQVLKMVVCTLGYKVAAEANGGWPVGYQITATSLGLMDKVKDSQYSEYAKRGAIAQIIYNALEVKMSETDAAGNITVSDKTLFNDYLKIKKLKGTLVGVGDYITNDSTIALGKNEMNILYNGEQYIIDYSSYTTDVTQINKNLGKTITVYYKQERENDERTLVIIDDESTNNTVTTVSCYDIDRFENDQLKYYTDGSKTKNLKINFNDISVRYNGKLVSDGMAIELKGDSQSQTVYTIKEAVDEWLDPDSDFFIYGSVTLTDNGADGDINLIEIMDYQTIVAYKAPTTSDYRIQDKLKSANYLLLDPNSPKYEFTISRDNAQIDITNIKANDVVLYAQSLDSELYTVYVTTKSVTGKITAINENAGTVEIDNKEYNIADSCENYIKNIENKTLKVGISGTFYLDMFDTVVFGTISEEKALPYAYISNAGIENSTDEGYLTVYAPSTNATEAVTYTMTSKVKVNGVSMKAEQVVDELNDSAKNSNADASEEMAEAIYGAGKAPTIRSASQLVRIKIENGKVSEIITMDDTSSEENVSNEDSTKLVKYRGLEKCYYSSNSFKASASSSSTYFTTNSSTVVICLPMDRTNSSKYAKKTVSSAFTSGESYYVEAYDVNSSKVAGLVVLYGSDSTLTTVKKTTDFSVVASSVKETYDEKNDETKQQVSVYRGAVSSPSAWTTLDTKEFSDVVPGDVIQFAYDSDNYIQGRINNIKFSDVADVLDTSNDVISGSSSADTVFDWTTEQEPTEDNNYQSYLFDYRFKKEGSDQDETYSSSTLGTIPYSRAFVANVSQVLTDSNKIYVTKSGFTQDSSGEWTLDDTDYEEIPIGSAKIIRMESNRKEFSPYVEDTTTALTYNDLKDAKNYGTECSKVLICTRAGSTKLIVIYN